MYHVILLAIAIGIGRCTKSPVTVPVFQCVVDLMLCEWAVLFNKLLWDSSKSWPEWGYHRIQVKGGQALVV